MVGAGYFSRAESSVGGNRQHRHSDPDIRLGVGGCRPPAAPNNGLTHLPPVWGSSQTWTRLPLRPAMTLSKAGGGRACARLAALTTSAEASSTPTDSAAYRQAGGALL